MKVSKNNDIFASRLKLLRKGKQLTQGGLADALNEFTQSEDAYKTSTISAWEARGVIPGYEKLREMADYFGVTVSFLSGTATPPETMELVTKFRELTIEDLKQLSGECVYVITNSLLHTGHYGIVSAVYEGILFENGNLIKFKDLKYPVIRVAHPLKCMINYIGMIPLERKQAMEMESVWINFMLTPKDEARNGWYRYDKKTNRFVSEKDPSFSLGAELYAESYIAYRDPFEVDDDFF